MTGPTLLNPDLNTFYFLFPESIRDKQHIYEKQNRTDNDHKNGRDKTEGGPAFDCVLKFVPQNRAVHVVNEKDTGNDEKHEDKIKKRPLSYSHEYSGGHEKKDESKTEQVEIEITG